MMARLEDPITKLPGTASVTFKKFASIGINSFGDLLNYVPKRYKDYRAMTKIGQLNMQFLENRQQEVFFATVSGIIIKKSQRFLKNSLTMQIVTIEDDGAQIDCVWFRQPYILTNLNIGIVLNVSGAVRQFGSRIQMSVDEYEVSKANKPLIHTHRLVPVYSEKKGLSSRTIRDKMMTAILSFDEVIEDPLPSQIVKKNKLSSLDSAYRTIHFPVGSEDSEIARKRLAFNELFVIQLTSRIIRKQWDSEKVGHPFKIKENLPKIEFLIKSLPFKLTGAQIRTIDEIVHDLGKISPMNRLLQGDVGSGKTVVATVASYLSYLSGFTTLFMAPTEILAMQHFKSLTNFFKGENMPKVSLKTGTQKLEDADIIVGTHALIASKIQFDRVGLIIIDEQHKFGVSQRAQLKEKGINPHLLTMTATPIPRSVSLTLYGELDLSIIDEMPLNRKSIKTYVITEEKRGSSYDWMNTQIEENHGQIFIVCPLIDESEHETMQSVRAANKEFEKLKDEIFHNRRIELLHGRMKSAEKEAIMSKFARGEIDILVTTSVVEVGVDIPNATVMVIESSERYGLAQLHQLRGRVGRGDKQSYCLLFTSTHDSQSNSRLSYFASTESGFELAKYDLVHRGTGEIYGKRQHGASDLVLASLNDTDLLSATKKSAEEFLEKYNLSDYPKLEKKVELQEKKHISQD